MNRCRPSRTPTGPRHVVPGVLVLLATWCAALLAGAAHRGPGGSGRRADRERGDVPGWVMITLMTAGLVVALWAVAGDRLAALFTQALDAVTKLL